MASYVHLQPVDLGVSQTRTVHDRSRVSGAEGESRRPITACHEVARSINAAWLFELAHDATVVVDIQTEKNFEDDRVNSFREPVQKLVPELCRSVKIEHSSRYSVALMQRAGARLQARLAVKKVAAIDALLARSLAVARRVFQAQMSHRNKSQTCQPRIVVRGWRSVEVGRRFEPGFCALSFVFRLAPGVRLPRQSTRTRDPR